MYNQNGQKVPVDKENYEKPIYKENYVKPRRSLQETISGNTPLMIGVIIAIVAVVLMIAGGIYYYYYKKKPAAQAGFGRFGFRFY